MLTLRSGQVRALERSTAAGFVQDLLARLAAERPAAFGGQPLYVRQQMVVNGLACAAAFGFTLRSTLGGFAALQCRTAADFHCHPLVRPVLLAREPERRRFDRLLAEVPAEVWDTLRRGADLRAWFEPRQPAQRPVRIAAQVCAVFPELVEQAPAGALPALFRASISRAARHGIAVESGVAVFAAALAIYGDTLDRPGGPSWAAQVFEEASLAPARIVALLRLRLLLDTDRLI